MSKTRPTSKLAFDALTPDALGEAVQGALAAAIVESSDDGIVSKTLDGIIQSWNGGATRLFGYTAEEAIGKSITMLIPPELQAEEKLIIGRIREGKRIDHFDTVRIAKDGRRIPISLTVSPVRDAMGTIIGASKIVRDISERKRIELALQTNESQLQSEANALVRLNECSSKLWGCRNLRAGLEVMLDAAVDLLGADATYIRLLDAASDQPAAAHRNVPAALLQGMSELTDDDYVCSAALDSARQIIIDDVDICRSFAPMRALLRAAGHRALVCTPLIGGDGARLGALSAVFRVAFHPSAEQLRRMELYGRQASDFIQRCRVEERLRDRERELQEADRRKDEFLALLAHELRNPLAPIRYALAATRKSNVTNEQKSRAEGVIERQVTHMSRLLDDLLDVSRITRGTLELKKSQTELTSILGSAIEAARPLLDDKGHTLTLDLPDAPVRVDADPVRLAQVFSNLLINAAKYTDRGGRIWLKARREAQDIVISVRDNGIGITMEMMPRLFSMFTQSRDAIGRSEGGLGVGLSLVEGLIKLHGGSVVAHSDGPHQGSEFIVRMPIGMPTPVLRLTFAAAEPSVAVGLKILVVDDNRDAADTFKTFLELSGHSVHIARTGSEALALAELHRPQVLLLDIGLPDQNGYELAAKIRSMPWASDAMLVAITGFGQEEDRRRAIAAGFDQHLTKPIDPTVLEPLLQSIAVNG